MHWNPAVGVPLLIVGLIVLALIWLFGQPRAPKQGQRQPRVREAQPRREPTLGGDEDAAGDFGPVFAQELDDARAEPEQGSLDVGLREELQSLSDALGDARAAPVAPPSPAQMPRSDIGRRPEELPVERIVTLFVVARDDGRFRGPDLVVAAEKAGLDFGDMGIFHRLLDGKHEAGPVFSVANMVKPGHFDLGRVTHLETPGLSFFMTLPGPLPALDAWDAMLPTAQRMAELLDGLVLDEERNALGRQRIAHLRDELRGWDRRHEGDAIDFGR